MVRSSHACAALLPFAIAALVAARSPRAEGDERPSAGRPPVAALAPRKNKPLSTEFEFDDARFLVEGQRNSAYVHLAGVPARGELPLVVFLHGLNFTGQKHMWMGGPQADLRTVADRVAARTGAFILAAPSQTKDAAVARTLWSTFDLGAFVGAVDRVVASTSLHVDRGRILLVGHSGAGCNPDGGLFAPVAADDDTPRAILAIDTCLDEEMGRSAARTQRRVIAAWQDVEWPRDSSDALRGFSAEVPPQRAAFLEFQKIAVEGPDAHNAVVPATFERVLPALLALD